MNKILLTAIITSILLLSAPLGLCAYEETVTVPAESSDGVTLELEEGEYIVRYAGGAITLSYPINSNYRWLVGTAVGIEAEGGQDLPDIGAIYFDPEPASYTQSEAEKQAVEAADAGLAGTYLRFTLDEEKEVRFWVSDYDYSDNSGMIKLRITAEKE